MRGLVPKARGRARRLLVFLAIWAVLAPPAVTLAEGWFELRGDGLLLRFRGADRPLAGVLLGDLVSGREEIAERLGTAHDVQTTVYLASSEDEFRSLTGGRIPHWGVGCAFPETGRVVLRNLPGQSGELLRTARHEMSHILLRRTVSAGYPVWFDEGVAMWASREWRLRQSVQATYAVLSGGLVPLAEIDAVLSFASPRADLAYTESLLAVTFLIHAGGRGAVAEIVADLASGTSFPVALYRVTGYTPKRFEDAWAEYVRGRFGLTSVLAAPEALWFYMALLFLVAYLGVRRRNRVRTREWEEEDPAEGLPLRLRLQVFRRKGEP